MKKSIPVGLVVVGALFALVMTTGAKKESLEDNAAFSSYADQAIAEVFLAAKEVQAEPSIDELLSVLQFRSSCQVIASVVASRGSEGSRARLEAIPAEALAIGQPEASAFFSSEIVSAARRGDWERLESFVSTECDPEQDMSVSVRK